ncbi:EAL domain-containing protein [Thiohalorhabdus sp. Cl-TMA]|uniref:EAL domain-containing protein n=1 Tax=Thiohalorhabdus methylotrophus TaxID=3242694 RepID=A0ABV4TXY1_9GAMM
MSCAPINAPLGPVPDPVVAADSSLQIIGFNTGAEAVFGCPAREVLGRDLVSLFPERFVSVLYDGLGELREEAPETGRVSRRLNLFGVRQDGEEVALDATLCMLQSGRAESSVVLVLRSHSMAAEQGPQPDQGKTDGLTALPNRILFPELVDQSLKRLEHHGRNAAVILIDLNRFRLINSSLGQAGGDRLLTQVGRRLQSHLRPGDTVGRQGGDQFAVFLNDLGEVEHIPPLVARLMDSFSDPFQVQGYELFVTASAGVSVFPDDGTTSEDLLQRADMARTRAEDTVQNNWAFFAPDLDTKAWERLELEARLSRALERQEFHLVYQPIVDLASHRMIGVEALLRWAHPELGPVSPGVFIPLLEETGMIVAVGQWVLQEACQQLRAWQDAGVGPLDLSINLSPRQFADRQLESILEGALRESGVGPGQIRLEITESLFLRDLPEASEILSRLNDRGFRLALDDFGTGFSALNYLRRLPFHSLKIDRSFLADIPRVVEDTALVRGIIHLADTLRIRTVAEGVERSEQAEFLRWLGCPEAQGFGFSPPVSAEDISRLAWQGGFLSLAPE